MRWEVVPVRLWRKISFTGYKTLSYTPAGSQQDMLACVNEDLMRAVLGCGSGPRNTVRGNCFTQNKFPLNAFYNCDHLHDLVEKCKRGVEMEGLMGNVQVPRGARTL